MNEEGGGNLDAYLDTALAAGEPVPEPSPCAEPCASPSPSPSASPDALVLLVEQVHREQQYTRVANTGTFYGVSILIIIAVAALLFSALRRR